MIMTEENKKIYNFLGKNSSKTTKELREILIKKFGLGHDVANNRIVYWKRHFKSEKLITTIDIPIGKGNPKGKPFKCLNEKCPLCKDKMCGNEIVYKEIAPCYGRNKVKSKELKTGNKFNREINIEAARNLSKEKQLGSHHRPLY